MDDFVDFLKNESYNVQCEIKTVGFNCIDFFLDNIEYHVNCWTEYHLYENTNNIPEDIEKYSTKARYLHFGKIGEFNTFEEIKRYFIVYLFGCCNIKRAISKTE